MLSLLMWPLRTVAYYRLAMREEREMMAQFGAAYEVSRRHMPSFLL